MEVLVATPPGEVPPALTEPFAATPVAERERVVLNTSDVFTFALWSKRIDFLRWEVCNMPFELSCGLSSIVGAQPLHLTMYSLKSGAEHVDDNKTRFFSLMLSRSDGAPRVEAAESSPDELQAMWGLPPLQADEPPPEQATALEEAAAFESAQDLPRPLRCWTMEAAESSPDDLQTIWGLPPLQADEPPPEQAAHWMLGPMRCCTASDRHTIR